MQNKFYERDSDISCCPRCGCKEIFTKTKYTYVIRIYCKKCKKMLRSKVNIRKIDDSF